MPTDFASQNSHTTVQSQQRCPSQKLLLCECFICAQLGVPQCLCLRVDTFKEFRGEMLRRLSIYKPCVEVQLILAGFTSWQVLMECAESHYNEWRCVCEETLHAQHHAQMKTSVVFPEGSCHISYRRNMKRTHSLRHNVNILQLTSA